MDIKKRYKNLVKRLRTEFVRDGKRLTAEDISFELGYTKGYFEKLVSSDGKPTELNLIDLLLHFPELWEGNNESNENSNYKKIKRELQLTRELLREKNTVIHALRVEVESLKRQVELLEMLNINNAEQ